MDFETRKAAFDERRRLRHGRGAPGAGNAERHELAGVHKVLGRRDGDEGKRNVAPDRVIEGERSALVWHMLQCDAGPLLQQLAREMRGPSCPAGAEGIAAGRAFRKGYEFGQILRAKGRMGNQQQRRIAKLGDRLEVL